MKLFKVLMVALAAMMVTATSVNANAIDENYNKAAELIGAKKFGEAIPVLRSVIESGLKAGPDALQTVQDAQKLLPTCLIRNAATLFQGGQMDEAVKEWSEAAELAELYGDETSMRQANGFIGRAYTAMAATAFNNKDYVKASEIFAKGFAANPNDTALGLNLAMSYCEMGQMESGLEVYKKIMALEAVNSKYKADAATAKEKAAYYIMLDAAKAAGEKNYDKAVADAEAIIAFDALNAQANLLLLQSYTNLKNYDKMIEVGAAAIAAQPTDALKSDAAFLVGAAYQNKENKAKAIEMYRQVVAGANIATAKAQIAALSK